MCTNDFVRVMSTVDLYGNRGFDSQKAGGLDTTIFLLLANWTRGVPRVHFAETCFQGWRSIRDLGLCPSQPENEPHAGKLEMIYYRTFQKSWFKNYYLGWTKIIVWTKILMSSVINLPGRMVQNLDVWHQAHTHTHGSPVRAYSLPISEFTSLGEPIDKDSKIYLSN